MRRLLSNLLMLSITSILCLVVMETGVRVWAPQRFEPSYPAVYQEDPRLGHVMRPHAEGVYRTREFEVEIKTNADGFRDRDYGRKMPSAFRILCIGDSFTLGAEVDQGNTYSKVLETLLNTNANGIHYEVLNLGVRAYGTEQELQLLREFGLRYQPDFVILQFYLANDLYENHPRAVPPYKVVNGFVVPVFDQSNTVKSDTSIVEGQSPPVTMEGSGPIESFDASDLRLPIPFKYWLAKHSDLYLFVRKRYHILMRKWMTRAQQGASHGNSVVASTLEHPSSSIQWISWMEPSVRVYSKVYDEDMTRRWGIVDSLLQEFHILSVEHRFHVLVMNAPLRERLDPGVLEAWGFDPAQYDPIIPDAKLDSLADKYGFTMVRLYPKFAKAARQGEPLYWTVDGHWTPAGHRLVARTLYNVLRQSGMLLR